MLYRSVILAANSVAAVAFGSGIAEMGINGYLQGYVSAKGNIFLGMFGQWGGLTLGPSAIFHGGLQHVVSTMPQAMLTWHEFGHTIQFIAGSMLGNVVDPWITNIGFGLLGTTSAGNWWGNMASAWGRTAFGH